VASDHGRRGPNGSPRPRGRRAPSVSPHADVRRVLVCLLAAALTLLWARHLQSRLPSLASGPPPGSLPAPGFAWRRSAATAPCRHTAPEPGQVRCAPHRRCRGRPRSSLPPSRRPIALCATIVMTANVARRANLSMAYKGDRKEFLQLRLSPQLKERIRAAARADGVTMTWFVEDAIEQKLRRTRKIARTAGS